jgi:hypothetical protein
MTHRAMPVNTVVFIISRIGHDDSGTTSMLGPASAAHRRRIVEIACRIQASGRLALSVRTHTVARAAAGACVMSARKGLALLLSGLAARNTSRIGQVP